MAAYILNFAPAGRAPTRSHDKPARLSVSEIVDDVLMAAERGAAIAHLQARDPVSGAAIVCPEVYGDIIGGIRKFNTQVILCVSLSGRGDDDDTLRAAPLCLEGDLKPDMASLTFGQTDFLAASGDRPPATMRWSLAEALREARVAPEIEIVDLCTANHAHVLAGKNLLPAAPYMNILLGDAGSTHARLSQMAALLGSLPPGAVTSLAGRGRSQLATSVIALGEGCGVGVGRDEGAACDRGATRESNAMLLRRLATIACEMELEPAQPRQVRLLLGLRPGDGKYGLREARPATGAAH